jgi:hypothetical protein
LRIARLLSLAAVCFLATAPAAIISVNGYFTPAALDMPQVSGTSFGSPVIAFTDGYTTSPPGNNTRNQTFSTDIIVQPNNQSSGTLSSAPIAFSAVPVVSIGGQLYFAFVYDVAETGGTGRLIQVTNINITVASVVVWTMTDIISLNDDPDTANHTPGALNASSSDMGFYLPVSVFNGLGLTGSSTFIFTASWAQGNNGGDQWVLTDDGLQGIEQAFFGANTPVQTVPEPGTIALVLLATLNYAVRLRTSRS